MDYGIIGFTTQFSQNYSIIGDGENDHILRPHIFENEYVCAMLGNLAACRFYEGDVVAATLRFSTHEYQNQVFQEILVTDIVKLNK